MPSIVQSSSRPLEVQIPSQSLVVSSHYIVLSFQIGSQERYSQYLCEVLVSTSHNDQEQQPTDFKTLSSCFCSRSQPTHVSHASLSIMQCPLSRFRARRGGVAPFYFEYVYCVAFFGTRLDLSGRSLFEVLVE